MLSDGRMGLLSGPTGLAQTGHRKLYLDLWMVVHRFHRNMFYDSNPRFSSVLIEC